MCWLVFTALITLITNSFTVQSLCHSVFSFRWCSSMLESPQSLLISKLDRCTQRWSPKYLLSVPKVSVLAHTFPFVVVLNTVSAAQQQSKPHLYKINAFEVQQYINNLFHQQHKVTKSTILFTAWACMETFVFDIAAKNNFYTIIVAAKIKFILKFCRMWFALQIQIITNCIR